MNDSILDRSDDSQKNLTTASEARMNCREIMREAEQMRPPSQPQSPSTITNTATHNDNPNNNPPSTPIPLPRASIIQLASTPRPAQTSTSIHNYPANMNHQLDTHAEIEFQPHTSLQAQKTIQHLQHVIQPNHQFYTQHYQLPPTYYPPTIPATPKFACTIPFINH